MTDPDAPRPVRLPWRDAVVLVCRECDGRGGLSPKKVRKALKGRVGATLPRRSVRVLAASCLDACPKQGVTVATAGASERAVVVRTRAQCDGVVDALAADLPTAS
ncbi:hypothetical protein PO878_21440 [Iamia majanohamensis]|uniref:(2Fe-2S) ferredoxin domain-containing protein n=1 Tax=Iamia majanohamensis TaxID=467976 RepID=A0AAF0BTP2_9ACTN|nr:hypothetical protein [Iamia majanohamensis]WCO67057.1 hypothetical protein PO878_21440 [Iamia majanohamensis]